MAANVPPRARAVPGAAAAREAQRARAHDRAHDRQAVAGNLLHPLLLLRAIAALAAAALALHGVRVAAQVLRRWRVGSTSEGQLALERRAELGATLVAGTFLATGAGLVLSVLAADRLAPSIRGAMCAYGVLDATPYGFLSLGTSALAAVGCGLWLTLHRLDLATPLTRLTRRKFVALLALAPLVLADGAAQLAHIGALDLGVVASCCSSSLDAVAPATAGHVAAGPRELAGVVAATSALAAIGAALGARRRPHGALALAAAGLSLVAAAAAAPAVLWWVAPHAYESPHHLCPFCLLRSDALGLGWPLFAALFFGLLCGAALGLVATQRAASGAPAEADALARRLAGRAALAWTVALALGLAPIARYWLVTGGASLFGGAS
jgi:hypothetical protein